MDCIMCGKPIRVNKHWHDWEHIKDGSTVCRPGETALATPHETGA